jgi:hypothetical protein
MEAPGSLEAHTIWRVDPENADPKLLERVADPLDELPVLGPLIIMESRHLDRETVEGHFRAVGGA